MEQGKPAKFTTGWTLEAQPKIDKTPLKIYVASSWKNTYYPEVVQALRDAGIGTSRAFRRNLHSGDGR